MIKLNNLNENRKPDMAFITPDCMDALVKALKILIIKEFKIGEVFEWNDVLKKTPEGVIKITMQTNVAGEEVKCEMKIKDWDALQHAYDALIDEELLESIAEKLGFYKRIK